MDTGNNQRRVTRFDPVQQPAAEAVAKEDCLVVAFRNPVNRLLKIGLMMLGVFMERQGKELQVDPMRTLGGEKADLPSHDRTSNDFEKTRPHLSMAAMVRSDPFCHPKDRSAKDFSVVGIIPSLFVMAGLDDDDSSRLIRADPSEDG